ncbi:MAG: LacI family DNA-binding transcriptional regulator [Victivallaceae bacterium]|nr:LacI family DNA-binding transcriptional regulator [Victivallaceae bacterium]
MAITLKNISGICGVDISTVSRALRNDLRVKPETRRFIQKKARELGYRPNLAARNLVSGKTLNLWMILSDLNNPVDREPAQFLSRSLHLKGYELLITLYHAEAKKFNHLLSRLSQHVADGAFIIPSLEYSAPAYLPLFQNDFPLVFIDRQPLFDNCTTVTTDNKAAVTDLLRKCLDAGADRFIIITENDNSVSRLRLKTAIEFLTRNNSAFIQTDANTVRELPPKFLTGNIALLGSSRLDIEKYFQIFFSRRRPSLLISASFDSPPLNTADFNRIFVARQDFESIAETAADLMLEKISGSHQAETVEIPRKEIIEIK